MSEVQVNFEVADLPRRIFTILTQIDPFRHMRVQMFAIFQHARKALPTVVTNVREYFGVFDGHVPVDIGVQSTAEAAHLTYKEVLALVKADFVDDAVLPLLLPAVVAVTQFDQPAGVLVHHVAMQVFRVARLVLAKLAQVLLVAAVFLEVEVQLTAGGELNVTLLTPVKVVVEMRVRYVLSQALKQHRFVITVSTVVGIFLVDF